MKDKENSWSFDSLRSVLLGVVEVFDIEAWLIFAKGGWRELAFAVALDRRCR